MSDEVYMTLEEAEQIVMAAEVGMYEGDRVRLAHALLLVEQDSTYTQEFDEFSDADPGL